MVLQDGTNWRKRGAEMQKGKDYSPDVGRPGFPAPPLHPPTALPEHASRPWSQRANTGYSAVWWLSLEVSFSLLGKKHHLGKFSGSTCVFTWMGDTIVPRHSSHTVSVPSSTRGKNSPPLPVHLTHAHSQVSALVSLPLGRLSWPFLMLPMTISI